MSMKTDTPTPDIVSFDDESLILVDSNDQIVGHMPKVDAHVGQGTLHRAFSIFLFNRDGQVLMQQRADGKPLWGGFWSNSVCSHPRRGEEVTNAAKRRLREEIDIDADVIRLYKFEYHAQFNDERAEYEMCTVFVACSDDPVAGNPTEIADFAFMSPEELDRELAENPDNYTPWLKMEWPRIRQDHWDTVVAMISDNT